MRAAARSLNVYLRKQPVDLREHFDNISTVLPGWRSKGEGQKFSAELVEELGTDLYLDRNYLREDDPDGAWLGVHIVYYTGMIDAVPHVPDRCLVAGGLNPRTTPENYLLPLDRSGWQPQSDRAAAPSGAPWQRVTYLHRITREPLTVTMPDGEFRLRTTEFSKDDQLDHRIYAGYLFVANGRVAVTPEEVKLLAFRKSEQYAYYCKVQYFAMGDRELTPERFVERCADFTDVLLPELMRCLPDWPTMQDRMAAADD